MNHPFASSLDLLKRTIDMAPDFFSAEKKQVMMRRHEELVGDPKTTRGAIDQAIIECGKEIYPYRKAFWMIHNRFGRDIENRSIKDAVKDTALKEKLDRFLKTAGTIADIGRGTRAFDDFFVPEERVVLMEAKLAAHDRVVSEIHSLCTGPEKDTCTTHIGEFKAEQEQIEKLIVLFRAMAERSDKWRAEILDKARTFDEGWSGLEREVREEDVRGEIEFYAGAIEATEGSGY